MDHLALLLEAYGLLDHLDLMYQPDMNQEDQEKVAQVKTNIEGYFNSIGLGMSHSDLDGVALCLLDAKRS